MRIVCSWCGADADANAAKHEGPHSTWCVHYRKPLIPIMYLDGKVWEEEKKECEPLASKLD